MAEDFVPVDQNMADVFPNYKSKSSAAARDFEVEFDRAAGVKYQTCQYCCVLPLLTVCLSCPCIPCAPCLADKDLDSQKCKINESEIYVEIGWINKTSKRVPLDRVQDVSISQGCVQKCFGVYQLDVQTAANSGPDNTAEVSLLAPKDAEMIRDFIMTKREARVIGPRPGVGQAPVSTNQIVLNSLGTNSQSEVEKLKAEVARLEAEKAQREIDALKAQVAKLEAEKQQKV